MSKVFIGKVPSNARVGEVLVLGRQPTIGEAIRGFESGDEEVGLAVVTPRFDHAWVPEGIKALGEMHETVWSTAGLTEEWFLEFDLSLAADLVSLFERLGVTVERDDRLLRRAEDHA